jgi:diphthine synthase
LIRRFQTLVFSTLSKLKDVDLGKPLHSLVIVGKTHPLEKEALEFFTHRPS